MDIAKSGSYKDSNHIRAKRVLKSLLGLVVVYCLIMACWPVLGKVYTRFYCVGANFLFGSFGSKGIVEFVESKEAGKDIEVRLYNAQRRDQNGAMIGVRASHSSREDGYIYAAFLVALIAATPITVKRKLWALLWGLVLLHCFIALKLAVRLIDGFSNEPVRLFVISSFWKKGFYTFYQEFIVNVTFGFVVAIFIWVLVTFRRGDWSRIISAGGQEPKLALKDLKRETRAMGVGA
jgi:hypothetical protein